MPRQTAVEFLDTDVRFVEQPPPVLTPWERDEVDRIWRETRAAEPAVFDGPVVAAVGVDRSRTGPLSVRWAPMTYRFRGLRRLRPPGRVPGSLFVTVLLPTESGLLVGRGAPDTAAPGRWTLPGGAVEPPAPGNALDVAGVLRHGARELEEETGVRVPAGELRLWALTRSARFGSLGFHLVGPALPRAFVRRRHAALSGAGTGHEAGGELDRLAFVASSAEADALGRTTDHLRQVVGRYFGEDGETPTGPREPRASGG